MGQAIPTQHPAVVLRSHYTHLRTLLAISMIAVIGLSVAVAILATDDGSGTSAGTAAAIRRESARAMREGPVSGLQVGPAPAGRRYDGGPEEGTRGAITETTTARYDGGPDEGSRGPGR